MAKYDSQFSRVAAVEEDDAIESMYRPVAPSKTRATRMQLEPSAPRERAGPEGDGDDAFLRSRRRVPVRRGFVPRTRNGRIFLGVAVALALGALIALAVSARNFLRSDARLRIDSASNIQMMGSSQVTRPELLAVFGSDIGRNILFVPLEQRRAELEQLPWVARAAVVRLFPNQLRVSIVERVPVAFVRNGNSVGLVDAEGVLLSLPPALMAAKRYSFPVVKGITADDPLPLRAARMRLYQQFITGIDSGGGKVSSGISEVDLSDPEDIRAFLPVEGSDILVHFGDGDFLKRYQRYRQHLDEWRRQYPHLASVDLRYDNQAVLEMAGEASSAAAQRGGAPGTESKNQAAHSKPAAGAQLAVEHPAQTQLHNARHSATRRPVKHDRKQNSTRHREQTRSQG